MVARRSAQIHSAILHTIGDDAWTPAATQGGELRPGAAVIELTDRVDTTAWPAGTRLIVRREPLHPGAQRSLFPSETYRYWGHWTDQPGTPVELDVSMRAHARVEDHIRRLKASGLERFPFTNLDANKAWLATVGWAADLVRWFQLLCLTGPLAAAEPKTLRWRLWHTPARHPQGPAHGDPAPRRLARHRRDPRRLRANRRHRLTTPTDPDRPRTPASTRPDPRPSAAAAPTEPHHRHHRPEITPPTNQK